jgi:hypothetical protein
MHRHVAAISAPAMNNSDATIKIRHPFRSNRRK